MSTGAQIDCVASDGTLIRLMLGSSSTIGLMFSKNTLPSLSNKE